MYHNCEYDSSVRSARLASALTSSPSSLYFIPVPPRRNSCTRSAHSHIIPCTLHVLPRPSDDRTPPTRDQPHTSCQPSQTSLPPPPPAPNPPHVTHTRMLVGTGQRGRRRGCSDPFQSSCQEGLSRDDLSLPVQLVALRVLQAGGEMQRWLGAAVGWRAREATRCS